MDPHPPKCFTMCSDGYSEEAAAQGRVQREVVYKRTVGDHDVL